VLSGEVDPIDRGHASKALGEIFQLEVGHVPIEGPRLIAEPDQSLRQHARDGAVPSEE
jgi:hypothetical protein